MDFRIADTFADSLAKLTGDEQKSVKTTAFDLQMNPAQPGMQFHRIDKSKDKNFWSVRVSSDIRLIVHKTQSSLLLCFVAHHDDAYRWAERRKLETHPKTGAAQLVEIRERVEEIVIPKYVEVTKPAPAKTLLFSGVSDEALLSYGVPQEWLADIRLANEDTVLQLADHLPSEAAEAILELATGGTPLAALPAVKPIDPFSHPDAQRRFRAMKNVEELEHALAFPWERWTVFLHPSQRELVVKDYAGPARVAGSAGTGKTVVALHRAVYLARANPDARVLLTTFSTTLANALRTKLRRLISNDPRLGERVEVHATDAIAQRLYESRWGVIRIASENEIRQLISDAASGTEAKKFTSRFLETEWQDIVDAWQLQNWESYRDVKRLGRKTRLPEAQRAVLWTLFDRMRATLMERGLLTKAAMLTKVTIQLSQRKQRVFDHVVVDEAQDVSVAQLKLLAELGSNKPNGLFFAGDLGQRIFQLPFSWKALGVDVRGRSKTLHINYRTSHQIRKQADRLLGPEVSDVDGNVEDRRGTVSVFNGPVPTVVTHSSTQAECESVGSWLKDRLKDGVEPHEIGVFVRSEEQVERASAAVTKSGLPFKVLDDKVETAHGRVSVTTMHVAKGLEFRAVVVMACDDEVIPLQERIESVTDDADLEEVYNTERHLLYVACTRARDFLLVSSAAPASEFLGDLSQ